MLSTLANDSIALHYQPLVGRQGELLGFEALMRWHHRQRGAISPEAFIPLFEENGLMLPLSRWAMSVSCQHAAGWPRDLRVWINVSAAELREGLLVSTVRHTLEDTGLAPERLQLEFREATLRDNAEVAARTLRELADLGVSLALDRFANGPTAAAALRRYPIDKVKIDGSLVAGTGVSVAAESVLHMLIDLAHSHHCEAAAAGVETEAQRAFLSEQGCDIFQGYLIGHPAPIDAFAHLVGGVRRSLEASASDMSVESLSGLVATGTGRGGRRAYQGS